MIVGTNDLTSYRVPATAVDLLTAVIAEHARPWWTWWPAPAGQRRWAGPR
jgi:hypothetical protein